MNPSFMAMQKAISASWVKAMMGIEPKPMVKKEKETSINGRAFAPGKGVQQELSGPEKEAKVDAHLAQLRKDVEVRTGVMGGHAYDRVGYTHWTPNAQRDVDLANARKLDDAQQAEKEKFNTAADDKVMTALYGSDNGAKIDDDTPHDIVVRELHRTHAAYIERRIALNRRNTAEKDIPLGETKYPTGYRVDLLHENVAEQEAERELANEIHARDLLDATTQAFKAAQAKQGIPKRITEEVKYPTSDLIDLLHERIAEVKAQTALSDHIEACIVYAGERRNIEE